MRFIQKMLKKLNGNRINWLNEKKSGFSGKGEAQNTKGQI